MIIEIDVTQLIRLKISAHQYLIARLMLDNQKILDKYVVASPITKDDIKALVQAKIMEEPDLLTEGIPKLTKNFFVKHSEDYWWDELMTVYPDKVVRPDGSSDWLKDNLTRAKALYLKKVNKNEYKHTEIISALARQVHEMTVTNKMGYFKRIYKWINDEGWLGYVNRLDLEDNVNLTLSYGTDLV